MTQIKGSIEYTLNIDPKGENHSLEADATIENGIVSLLMVEQMIAIQIEMWANQPPSKDSLVTKNRKKTIKDLNNSLKGLKTLTNASLSTYHDFKNYEAEQAERRTGFMKEQGMIPKEFSDLSNSEE